MLCEEAGQGDCEQTATANKCCKIEDVNPMEAIAVDNNIERKEEDTRIDHKIEQIRNRMHPLTQAHNKLILPTSFLPLINKQSNNLLKRRAIDQPDIDGQQEIEDYFYRV